MNIAIEHNIPEIEAAMRRAPELLMTYIDRSLGRGALEVAREAKKEAPKADSTLANSILSRKLGVADYEVAVGVQYATYVETGVKGKNDGGNGHAPDWDVLDRWVKRHGITPRTPGVTHDQLVYLIAKKIYYKGIKPHPFMAPALEAKTDRLSQLVRQGAQAGIAAVARTGARP